MMKFLLRVTGMASDVYTAYINTAVSKGFFTGFGREGVMDSARYEIGLD